MVESDSKEMKRRMRKEGGIRDGREGVEGKGKKAR